MTPEFDQLTVVLEGDHPAHLERLQQALSSSFEGLRQVHCLSDLDQAMALLPTHGTMAIIFDHDLSDHPLEKIRLAAMPCGPLIMLTSPRQRAWATRQDGDEESNERVPAGAIAHIKWMIDRFYARISGHHLEQSVLHLTQKLKKANRELARKNDRLTELATTAHRFVDNVAHEFRTPLTVIQEFTSILDDGIGGTLSQEQRRFLRYISAATQDLTQLVEDFLDSSRLKAQSLRVDRRPNEVSAMFEAVLPTIRVCGERKSVAIETRIEEGLNQAFCDAGKVGRILINLAINAVKFSPEGQTVLLWADAGNGSEVRLGVTDSGKGLTVEDQEMIGKRFKQFGDPQASSTKGFGLGLNIAKELVVLNLGQMQIQSKRGEGCTFSFSMPCCDPQNILAHYQQVMRDHFGSTPICLLRVTPRGRAAIEPLRRALSSISHPMDLVLPTVDQRQVLLLGASDQPDHWIERLTHDYQRLLDPPKLPAAKRAMSADQKLGPIEIDYIKSWQRAGWSRAMPGQVHQMLLGLPAAA
ncbi:MAG: HAMP domain-containing histidine kinase [Phycisphaeraceae bacterium]|nr:HAMP domain-containing histidine kinase [Phycisphaeraceae bacterium]